MRSQIHHLSSPEWACSSSSVVDKSNSDSKSSSPVSVSSTVSPQCRKTTLPQFRCSVSVVSFLVAQTCTAERRPVPGLGPSASGSTFAVCLSNDGVSPGGGAPAWQHESIQVWMKVFHLCIIRKIRRRCWQEGGAKKEVRWGGTGDSRIPVKPMLNWESCETVQTTHLPDRHLKHVLHRAVSFVTKMSRSFGLDWWVKLMKFQ